MSLASGQRDGSTQLGGVVQIAHGEFPVGRCVQREADGFLDCRSGGQRRRQGDGCWTAILAHQRMRRDHPGDLYRGRRGGTDLDGEGHGRGVDSGRGTVGCRVGDGGGVGCRRCPANRARGRVKRQARWQVGGHAIGQRSHTARCGWQFERINRRARRVVKHHVGQVNNPTKGSRPRRRRGPVRIFQRYHRRADRDILVVRIFDRTFQRRQANFLIPAFERGDRHGRRVADLAGRNRQRLEDRRVVGIAHGRFIVRIYIAIGIRIVRNDQDHGHVLVEDLAV